MREWGEGGGAHYSKNVAMESNAREGTAENVCMGIRPRFLAGWMQ